MLAFHLGKLGRRYWGTHRGNLFGLLPEPAERNPRLAKAGYEGFGPCGEAWQREFDVRTAALVESMAKRLGEPSVVAPRAEQSGLRGWLERLGPSRPLEMLNPAKLGPVAALRSVMREDTELTFAQVEFGRAQSRQPDTPSAMVFASLGLPILWVWVGDGLESWGDRLWEHLDPVLDSALDWELLESSPPHLASSIPAARLHRGESATWTDGSRVLGFMAGLGVQPAEIYLPPEQEWEARSPAWARPLRAQIVRDFEAMGVRVVAVATSELFDHDRRPKSDS